MAEDATSTIDAIPGERKIIPPPATMADFSSRSEAMLHCLELARLACTSSAPVLITGEHGSGKNLLAAAIHQSSTRNSRPCVVLDCAALGEKAVKTRLFGDAGDAYGNGGTIGLIAQADGGSLIIDEVDLLPGFVQKHLLGFLRQNSRSEASRSGASFRFGTRLITTGGGERNRKAGANLLIEDLLYYLGEITLRIPPLRRRREDIPALTESALAAANLAHGKSVGGLSRAAADFVRHYDFPGNVRELFLIIDRAVGGSSRDTLYVEDFGALVDSMEEDPHLLSDMTLMPLAEMEKRHIDRALLRTGWKKRAAARILRVSLTLLERKIALYGLEKGVESD